MRKMWKMKLICNQVKICSDSRSYSEVNTVNKIEVQIFHVDKEEVLNHFSDEELLNHVNHEVGYQYYRKYIQPKN